jgi:hypothetical protein
MSFFSWISYADFLEEMWDLFKGILEAMVLFFILMLHIAIAIVVGGLTFIGLTYFVQYCFRLFQ